MNYASEITVYFHFRKRKSKLIGQQSIYSIRIEQDQQTFHYKETDQLILRH